MVIYLRKSTLISYDVCNITNDTPHDLEIIPTSLNLYTVFLLYFYHLSFRSYVMLVLIYDIIGAS